MLNFDQLLKDLLYKHNCVVIPGFGGFVAKRIPARFDFENGKVFPPSKQVLFNPNLIDDDGLILHAISSINKISYEESSHKLSLEVENWKNQIEKGESIDFYAIGRLHLDKRGRFIFHQDGNSNHLKDSIGLEEISFISLIKEGAEIETSENEKDFSKRYYWSKKVLKYAAVFLILTFSFYSYWIPTQSDFFKSGILHWSDFNPFKKTQEIKYEKVALKIDGEFVRLKEITEKEIPSILEKNINENNSSNEELAFKNSEVNNRADLQTSNNTSIGKMKVVVGCFSEEKYIEKFLIKLKKDGFSPFREKHGRLTRVCISSTDDVVVAREFVATSRILGYKGWILK